MNGRLILERLVLPLTIVLVVSLGIFVVIYCRASDTGKATLEGEVGKSMLHVIAAVLIGNIVLVIIRDFEERRKGWLTKRDLLRADLTEGLQELYSRAKGARRRGRTSIAAATSSIDREKYDKLFQEISDIQLGLERFKREAEGGQRIGLLKKSLPDDLKSMEKYLGELVKECESELQSSVDNIPLTSLPKLEDFIGPYSGSRFHSEFVHPYHRVAQEVAEQMEKDLRAS